jgi:hypothetical protein
MNPFAPSRTIPAELLDAYTMNGVIPVIHCYQNDSYSHEQPIVYTTEQIQHFVQLAQNKMVLYYGFTDLFLYNAIEVNIATIQDKNIAILGSTLPWYESILLSYGAHPTTIEYNKISCEDPRLEFLTIDKFDANPRQFDAIFSISSFEHTGLGRYGDPLNPNGDLESMRKVKTMLKKNGLFFLSVPIGPDCLVWNTNRIYGSIRFPALLEGWKIFASYGFSPDDFTDKSLKGAVNHQPIFVLKPVENETDNACK